MSVSLVTELKCVRIEREYFCPPEKKKKKKKKTTFHNQHRFRMFYGRPDVIKIIHGHHYPGWVELSTFIIILMDKIPVVLTIRLRCQCEYFKLLHAD